MTSPALHGPLAAIAALPQPDLKTIFTAEPDRLSSLVLSQGPLRFDWSKTHLTGELIDAFLTLAQEQGFAAQRDALFAGEAVNNTEGRAAEHPAERGEGKADSVARAKALHARMRALIDAIEAGRRLVLTLSSTRWTAMASAMTWRSCPMSMAPRWSGQWTVSTRPIR